MSDDTERHTNRLSTSETQPTSDPITSLDMRTIDETYEVLIVSAGIAHAVSRALHEREDADDQSLAHALEYVHGAIKTAKETFARLRGE